MRFDSDFLHALAADFFQKFGNLRKHITWFFRRAGMTQTIGSGNSEAGIVTRCGVILKHDNQRKGNIKVDILDLIRRCFTTISSPAGIIRGDGDFRRRRMALPALFHRPRIWERKGDNKTETCDFKRKSAFRSNSVENMVLAFFVTRFAEFLFPPAAVLSPWRPQETQFASSLPPLWMERGVGGTRGVWGPGGHAYTIYVLKGWSFSCKKPRFGRRRKEYSDEANDKVTGDRFILPALQRLRWFPRWNLRSLVCCRGQNGASL